MEQHTQKTWYTSTVQHGDKLGRQIGFPTINLDPAILPDDYTEGVYSARVRVHKLDSNEYLGALYLGPRTIKGETTRVLEIFLLDFDQEIYEYSVSFQVHTFIRPVIHFDSLNKLTQQLTTDVVAIRKSSQL